MAEEVRHRRAFLLRLGQGGHDGGFVRSRRTAGADQELGARVPGVLPLPPNMIAFYHRRRDRQPSPRQARTLRRISVRQWSFTEPAIRIIADLFA